MEKYLIEARRCAAGPKKSYIRFGAAGAVLLVFGFMALCFMIEFWNDISYEGRIGFIFGVTFMYIVGFALMIRSGLYCNIYRRIYLSCNAAESEINQSENERLEYHNDVVLGERVGYIINAHVFVVYKDIKWIWTNGNNIFFSGRSRSYSEAFKKLGGLLWFPQKLIPPEDKDALCRRISRQYNDVLIGYTPQNKLLYRDYRQNRPGTYQTESALGDNDITYNNNNYGTDDDGYHFG